MKTVVVILAFCFSQNLILAQTDTVSSSKINSGRLIFITATHSAVWAGSLVALDQAWYRDFKRSKFHTFNDNDEWNQVDKCGHFWSTYGLSRVSAAAWKWTGMKRNTAAIMGAASGILFESVVEFQDGFSDQWGFSWGDMGANTLGAGMFLFQDLLWQEQRIQVKLSYWPTDYPGALSARRDQLFGKSFQERFLKDYNSQTYWLSMNIASLAHIDNFPKWLNISFGYGAENMLGARGNTWTDAEGRSYDYSGLPRYRQFYLSPDIDLTKIPSKKKWVRSFLSVLNAVKIPAPALELNSLGNWRFYWVKF